MSTKPENDTESKPERPRVLLVDDYPDAREMYSEYLQFAGFDVVEAGNGIEALERAADSAPDIILMDLSLPVMDGWEATRRLKADEATADIPMLVDETLRELFEFHDPSRILPSEPVPADQESFSWFAPRPAYAADDEITVLSRRLDRWIPRREELETYRDAVGRLLGHVSQRTAAMNSIDDRFADLYHHLVPTTAWQESCWRQFVEREGRVTYLLSSSGDIGLMQVNRRVWRGFFKLTRLEWDIAYNAAAGAEILGQLLRRYGVREANGRLENAARATYAAYNGGPGAYRRYRLGKIPRAQRAIDRAFWDKYQAIAAGQALDFVLCIANWGSASRTRLSTAPVDSMPKCSMRSRRSSATPTISARHASIASA